MTPALRSHPPRYPNSWKALHLGDDLKRITDEQLASVSRQLFGYHLVKLGNLSSELNLSDCPIKHRINVADQASTNAGVISKSFELPFAERCIDAFVLAHELDFSQDPHQVLREVDRCMMPDGHIVIVGFNPFSLPGCLRWLPFKNNNMLHDARFFSAHRVRDWLSLLGYQIIDEQRFVYSSLFFESQINSDSWWYRFASKYLPFFSSNYLIIGKKREYPLSLIKPAWKLKTRFAPVGASMRNATSE